MNMRPIPGQPGLFRQSLGLTIPGGPPFTWSVPNGRPWVLGSLSSEQQTLSARVLEMQAEYDALKRSLVPLTERYPFSPRSYEGIARAIVAKPRDATVRLTLEQFAQVSRGALSTVARSIALSQGILAAPATSSQLAKVRTMLMRSTRVMESYSTAVLAASLGQRAVGSAASLGFAIETGAAIAALIVGSLIFVVGVGTLYSILAEQQSAEEANKAAMVACAYDAQRGSPCGGAQYMAYAEQARQAQNEWGLMPDLNDLFKQGGSLLFWGGMLTIAGFLGYAAFTAEPARRNVQESVRRASEPRRTRTTVANRWR